MAVIRTCASKIRVQFIRNGCVLWSFTKRTAEFQSVKSVKMSIAAVLRWYNDGFIARDFFHLLHSSKSHFRTWYAKSCEQRLIHRFGIRFIFLRGHIQHAPMPIRFWHRNVHKVVKCCDKGIVNFVFETAMHDRRSREIHRCTLREGSQQLSTGYAACRLARCCNGKI